MTVEEIKDSITMTDLLSQYGIRVRGRMCSCPWHTDQHPSMKVFKDGANCFSCGWNGDIFKFVQDMEHCSFKDAFIRLGGHYEKHSSNTSRVVSKMGFEARKKQRQQAEAEEKQFTHDFSEAIRILRSVIRVYEPLSDEWTYAQNKLQYLLYLWEVRYTEQQEIDKFYVYREHRKIRQRFLPTA